MLLVRAQQTIAAYRSLIERHLIEGSMIEGSLLKLKAYCEVGWGGVIRQIIRNPVIFSVKLLLGINNGKQPP